MPIATEEEFKIYNKKVLRSRVDKILSEMKYFDANFEYTPNSLEVMQVIQKKSDDPEYKFTEEDGKIMDQFEKESYVVQRLFNVQKISEQPTTLDIQDNPEQLVTQQQIISMITSKYNGDKQTVRAGKYEFYTMLKEEFDLFNEIKDEKIDD